MRKDHLGRTCLDFDVSGHLVRAATFFSLLDFCIEEIDVFAIGMSVGTIRRLIRRRSSALRFLPHAAALFSLQLPLAAVVRQGNQKTPKCDTLPPCLWHHYHQYHITTATLSSSFPPVDSFHSAAQCRPFCFATEWILSALEPRGFFPLNCLSAQVASWLRGAASPSSVCLHESGLRAPRLGGQG